MTCSNMGRRGTLNQPIKLQTTSHSSLQQISKKLSIINIPGPHGGTGISTECRRNTPKYIECGQPTAGTGEGGVHPYLQDSRLTALISYHANIPLSTKNTYNHVSYRCKFLLKPRQREPARHNNHQESKRSPK